MLHVLPDGTRVEIRPIRPEDKALLERGLEQLSVESRQRRFLGAKPGFSAAELRYLTEVDGRDHIALVAVDADHPDQLIGVVRGVRIAEGGDTADVAIVIGDPWQGAGLGGTMMRALAQRARAQGLHRFSAVLQAGNHPAYRLLRGVSTTLEDGGTSGGVRTVAGEFAAG